MKIDENGLLGGLLHIMKNKATFELKGSEVQLFAQIMDWLEKDVSKMITDKKKKPIMHKETIKK